MRHQLQELTILVEEMVVIMGVLLVRPTWFYTRHLSPRLSTSEWPTWMRTSDAFGRSMGTEMMHAHGHYMALEDV